MFDVIQFYNDLLHHYVANVRRFSFMLWTNEEISFKDLLCKEVVSSQYGICQGLYKSLHCLYRNFSDESVIPRPVNFMPLLMFVTYENDRKFSGPHFNADFLVTFYPDIKTIDDQSIEAIKRNPKRYLQEV